MSRSLDDVCRELQVTVVEQVVVMLEQRLPVGAIDARMSDDLRQRLRVLRGKVHNCAPDDWREPVNAPQAQETPAPNVPASVSDVRARRAKAKERKRSVARARPKKARRVAR